jgi:hypothetical protein
MFRVGDQQEHKMIGLMDPVPSDWNIETALTVYAELFVDQGIDFDEAVERLLVLAQGDLRAVERAREVSLALQSPPDSTPAQWEILKAAIPEWFSEGPGPELRHRRRVDELLAEVEHRIAG